MEERETQQTTIRETTGEHTLIAATSTVVELRPNGSREAWRTRTIQRTTDGCLVDEAKPTYPCTCGCGTKTLSDDAVTTCAICQYKIKKNHTKTADDGDERLKVCPSCYEHGRYKRALRRTMRRIMGVIKWLLH